MSKDCLKTNSIISRGLSVSGVAMSRARNAPLLCQETSGPEKMWSLCRCPSLYLSLLNGKMHIGNCNIGRWEEEKEKIYLVLSVV